MFWLSFLIISISIRGARICSAAWDWWWKFMYWPLFSSSILGSVAGSAIGIMFFHCVRVPILVLGFLIHQCPYSLRLNQVSQFRQLTLSPIFWALLSILHSGDALFVSALISSNDHCFMAMYWYLCVLYRYNSYMLHWLCIGISVSRIGIIVTCFIFSSLCWQNLMVFLLLLTAVALAGILSIWNPLTGSLQG